MSTKAYYNISEIGAGKPGFSTTRSIIEAAFYGNNVVKVNTLKEAYELAKNSPGTIVTDMPVLRPLIGSDKEEIIRISRKIDTFETSILPSEDCCTVFTPRHPCTRPKIEDVREAESALDIDALVERALAGETWVRVKPQ